MIRKNGFASAAIVLAMGFGSAIIMAFLAGTIVWLIWPVAMGAFPGLVSSGALAAKINWWQAICLTWLMNFLVKSATAAGAKCPKEEKKE